MDEYSNWFTESIKTAITDLVQDTLKWMFAGIVPAIVSLSHFVALVGGGICIILYVAGYRSGLQKAGILFVGNAMIKYLLG